MIIRQMQPKDCFRAMALWQEIFRDTQPFGTFYFAHRFTPTLSFGVFEEDRLVSMALGRAVLTERPGLRAVLIAGVCTLPEFRGQGLMTETMQRLIANAAARGFDLALLSPAIPDLYAPFGFRPLSFAVEATETAAAPEELQRVSVVTDLRVPYLLYQIQSVSHPFMLHREKKDFLLTLREYAADGGVMLQTKDELGYLCFLPKEREVEVVECLAAYPEQYRLLLRAAAVYSPSQSATALLPADCGVPGKVVRPIHALGLKPSVRLDQIPELRRAFLVEQY